MTAVQHFKRIALGLSLLGLAAHASAQTQVSDAWVRATVPGQQSSGAFMTLTADSDSKLLSVQSPLTPKVEIHQMSMKDDVMHMGPVDFVALPAGQAVNLDPDGYHVMLLNLKQQIKQGDSVALTLTVENAAGEKQAIEVKAPVRALNSSAHSMKH